MIFRKLTTFDSPTRPRREPVAILQNRLENKHEFQRTETNNPGIASPSMLSLRCSLSSRTNSACESIHQGTQRLTFWEKFLATTSKMPSARSNREMAMITPRTSRSNATRKAAWNAMICMNSFLCLFERAGDISVERASNGKSIFVSAGYQIWKVNRFKIGIS